MKVVWLGLIVGLLKIVTSITSNTLADTWEPTHFTILPLPALIQRDCLGLLKLHIPCFIAFYGKSAPSLFLTETENCNGMRVHVRLLGKGRKG